MTTPRTEQVDLSITPFYHCMSRCVRQSYICGQDKITGKDYSYRKNWIVERLKFLQTVFCINIAAYAVMSNHYHIVLRVDLQKAENLSEDELLLRWQKLYPTKAREAKQLAAISATKAAITLSEIREQLTSISRFMAAMNQFIATMANKEDDCKGRFWDGRFKSQALLDEAAILSAMAYVDLNPIRAKIVNTPEDADNTSIQERIQAYTNAKKRKHTPDTIGAQPSDLMALFPSEQNVDTIDFKLQDYLELVDYSGRIIRDDKPGYIPDTIPPILDRLNLTHKGWFKMVRGLQKDFFYAVGHIAHLKAYVPIYRKQSAKCIDFVEDCYQQLN